MEEMDVLFIQQFWLNIQSCKLLSAISIILELADVSTSWLIQRTLLYINTV